MSHFYGSIQGSKGQATRCGTKKSGISAHIRGWNVGARVDIFTNEQGQDEVRVSKTGGSQGGDKNIIATYTKESL